MLLSMKLRSALAPCGSGQVYVYQPTKETSLMRPLCLIMFLVKVGQCLRFFDTPLHVAHISADG